MCDTRHLIHETWQVTGGRRWTFSQNFSTLALMVWELQVTCDTWHMTPDTWHVTHDKQHVSYDTQGVVAIVSKFEVPSSNDFGFIMFWRFGTKGLLIYSISNWGVCRTAPATPGLLINQKNKPKYFFFNSAMSINKVFSPSYNADFLPFLFLSPY